MTERDNWSSQFDYLLSLLGYAVGFGNVWRFPYTCYEHGGAVFIFCYIVAILLAGIPIFHLETSLGQFCSLGVVGSFDSVPIFQGVGYAAALITGFIAAYYAVLLAWTSNYFWITLKNIGTSASQLPWNNCDTLSSYIDLQISDFQCKSRTDINDHQATFTAKQKAYTKTPSEIFFNLGNLKNYEIPSYESSLNNKTFLNETFSKEIIELGNSGPLNYDLALALILSWSAVFFVIFKGVKTSGKVMYFLTLFPYLVLFSLLVKGIAQEGAGNGLNELFFKGLDFSKIIKYEVWVAAIGQVFYQFSAGMGGLLTLSSYSPFRNNVYRDTYLITTGSALTSILAAITVYSYIGSLHFKIQSVTEGILTFKDVVADGPGLVFMIWPEALSDMHTWFTCMMFFMMFLLGLTSLIGTAEIIVTAVCDVYPSYRQKRWVIVLSYCVIQTMIGMLMITDKGIHWFTLADKYSANLNIIVVGLVEIFAITMIYGIDRFDNDIRMMTGKKLPAYFKLCWKYATPIMLFIIVVSNAFSIITVPPSAKYFEVNYQFSNVSYIMGAVMITTPLLLMSIPAYKRIKRMGLQKAQLPTEQWGPNKDADRVDWLHLRDDNVVYKRKIKCDKEAEVELLPIS